MIQEVTKLKTTRPQSGAAKGLSVVPTFDLPADKARARMDVYVTWYVQKYLGVNYNQDPKGTKTFAHGSYQPSQYHMSQLKFEYFRVTKMMIHQSCWGPMLQFLFQLLYFGFFWAVLLVGRKDIIVGN